MHLDCPFVVEEGNHGGKGKREKNIVDFYSKEKRRRKEKGLVLARRKVGLEHWGGEIQAS